MQTVTAESYLRSHHQIKSWTGDPKAAQALYARALLADSTEVPPQEDLYHTRAKLALTTVGMRGSRFLWAAAKSQLCGNALHHGTKDSLHKRSSFTAHLIYILRGGQEDITSGALLRPVSQLCLSGRRCGAHTSHMLCTWME